MRFRQLFKTARTANVFLAIYRARGQYTRAGYNAFRDTPNPRETNGPLSIKANVTIVLEASLVSGRPKFTKIEILGQGPRENETRKWRWRQNGQVTDGIAYVAHKLKMGNLTNTLTSVARDWSSASSSPFVTQNDNDNDNLKTTLLNERPRQSVSLDLAIQGR